MIKANKTLNMTEGSPLKVILIFAIPLLIGALFQQVYNVVDTMIAGYLISDQAISAIGATSSLYALIINIALGLNTGYSVLMSRAFGKGDDDLLKTKIAFSFVFNILLGIILTILAITLLKPLLHLIKVPDNIFDEAIKYIKIIFLFMLASIIYNMFASILRALGNSRVPLYFLIISCIVNLISDIVLVKAFGCGVEGLAYATVISQILSAASVSIYFFIRYKEYIPSRKHFKFNKKLTYDMVTLGLSYMALNCVVTLGSVFFQSAINSLGDKAITAWTTSRKAIGALMQPLSCIASALATFTSQNYGDKKIDRIKNGFKIVITLELLLSIAFIGIGFLFGKQTIKLISGSADEQILKDGYISIICHFVAYPPLAILFCVRNGMQALGHKIIPVSSSIGELIIKIIVTYFVVPRVGFMGVCLTEPIIWVIFGVYILIAFIIEFRKKMILNADEAIY